MGNEREIRRTYDWIDPMFRAGLGETADISCAYYNGDYSLSLEEAQSAKHRWILEGINFKPGMRVLDIGSGWGPMLKAVKDAGGEAVGLTLSLVQAQACKRNGLEAYVKDWKELKPGEFGNFGAIVSLGAFEHFCSVEEFQSGKQDEIYVSFFNLCDQLLQPGSKLYLQAMTWGENKPPLEAISVDAPKRSDARLMALLEKFYPGSYPPQGLDQIVADAEVAGLKLLSSDSGRNDYIQTMTEWGRHTRPTDVKIIRAVLENIPQLVGKFITDKDFRYQLESMREGANINAFKQGLLQHYRMFFEKPENPSHLS